MKTVCNRDCFNCPYPDCVLDEPMSAEEYAEAREREELLKDPKARKLAAKQRAYYEANREELAAKQRAYREANREEYNAYMREYMRRRRSERTHA